MSELRLLNILLVVAILVLLAVIVVFVRSRMALRPCKFGIVHYGDPCDCLQSRVCPNRCTKNQRGDGDDRCYVCGTPTLPYVENQHLSGGWR